MKIGPYQLRNAIILAPMAGVTDRPFREIAHEFGVGLAVSEMVASQPGLRDSRKSSLRRNHDGETGIRSVQIVGTEPQEMADAAAFNVAQGAQIIDINMGCPAKKVCSKAAGSALLRDEARVTEILTRVVQAVDVPVTLKIRTGWSPEERNGVRIAQIAEQAGIKMLSVHGRTRACAFKGEAEYETIRQIKHTVDIPVIANGDIDTPSTASEVINFTGADGIMLGRAVQGNPWLIYQIDHYLQTGEVVTPPTPFEIKDVMVRHLHKMYGFYGEGAGLRIARKHLGWYCKSLPQGGLLKSQLMRADSAVAQLDIIGRYFDKRQLDNVRLVA